MAGTPIKFEIVKHIGVINRNDRGWTKELNIVSWNDQPPKYDIRDWDEQHERMSRGITLTRQENNKYIDLTTQEEFYGKNAKETSGDLAFMRNACKCRRSGRVCYNW